MNISLVDLLFNHKAEKCKIMDVETGEILKRVPSECFSSKRSARAAKFIKISGAMKLLDYLFIDKTAVLLTNNEFDQMYLEFEANGNRYHALYTTLGGVQFKEKELGCRYHQLFAFLLEFLAKNEKLVNLLFQSGMSVEYSVLKKTAIAGLSFVDEFYYGKTCSDLEIHMGCNGIVEQAEAASRSGVFCNVFGDERMFKVKPSIIHDAKEKKSDDTDSKESLWNEIKSGKYIIDCEWDDEQKPFITSPAFLDNYVPDSNFFSVFKKLNKRLHMALERMKKGDNTASKRDAINIFLAGKPGTGKTYMLFALSAAFGFPIRTIPLGKNTEEDTFEGMSKVIDGSLTDVRTQFFINAEKGGISAVEEINLADPDVVMGAIGQFVEFPFTIMEQGYKPVKRHALNIICGTMNIGTAGSKEISEALSSRFPFTYVLDDPKEEDFLKRLYIEGYEKKQCKWVYDVYSSILETLASPDYNAEDIMLNVTFRSCLGALRAIEDDDSPKIAIKNTMIGKIAEKDLEIAKRIWEEVVEPFREL